MEVNKSKFDPIKVIVDGVEYESIGKAARAYDKKPYVVYRRKDDGMSIEEAVKTPLKTPKTVVINRKKYRSLKNAFDKIGKITFSQYQARRHKVIQADKDLQKYAKYIIGLNDDAP
jgi:dihydrofolate reductase